jgi:hypothetical protein
MERSRSPGSGVDRLLAQIKPRWTQERHERVFAAILERIRRENDDDDRDASDDRPDADSGLGHYDGGHAHA